MFLHQLFLLIMQNSMTCAQSMQAPSTHSSSPTHREIFQRKEERHQATHSGDSCSSPTVNISHKFSSKRSTFPFLILNRCNIAIPSNQWLNLVSPNSNFAGPFLYKVPSIQSGMVPVIHYYIFIMRNNFCF